LFKSFIAASYQHGLKRSADKVAAEVDMFHRPERMARQ
jgi:hypothetical protein